MDKYVVKLYSSAYRELNSIYSYIAEKLSEPGTAMKIANALEEAILSLETIPERAPVRRNGVYGSGEYRQLFVKNYVIIYRVMKDLREVHIITVRYAASLF